jgi:hypothetical protein
MKPTTRSSNQDKHPGEVDINFMRRRSSEEVNAAKKKTAASKSTAAKEKAKKGTKVAEIEKQSQADLQKRKAEARAPKAVLPKIVADEPGECHLVSIQVIC